MQAGALTDDEARRVAINIVQYPVIRAGGESQDRKGNRGDDPRSIPLACRRGYRMKRRDFITLLGGAVASWPLTARAQQGERVRRIGVLMEPGDQNDPRVKSYISAFTQALAGYRWPQRADGLSRARRSWSACNPTLS
jgi:hypothetical protein